MPRAGIENQLHGMALRQKLRHQGDGQSQGRRAATPVGHIEGVDQDATRLDWQWWFNLINIPSSATRPNYLHCVPIVASNFIHGTRCGPRMALPVTSRAQLMSRFGSAQPRMFMKPKCP